jgi:hypothetical protein
VPKAPKVIWAPKKDHAVEGLMWLVSRLDHSQPPHVYVQNKSKNPVRPNRERFSRSERSFVFMLLLERIGSGSMIVSRLYLFQPYPHNKLQVVQTGTCRLFNQH